MKLGLGGGKKKKKGKKMGLGSKAAPVTSLFGDVDEEASGTKQRELIELDLTEEERLALLPQAARSSAAAVRHPTCARDPWH